MSGPQASIIVPVFNRAQLTRRFLDDVLGQRMGTPYELVVVDDGSTDATAEALLAYGNDVRVVRHARNEGFARSCNDGATAAAGDYLVFVNNDTLPQRGWLDALVRYADRHPEAAVVGSKLLYPDDTVQHAGVVISHDLQPRHLYLTFPADHEAVNKSRRFQAVTFACALVRRFLFEQMDGFDEGFVNGYEDVDLCLRLGEAGFEVHYCHESVLYHLESATRSSDSPEGQELFLRRWSPRLRPDELDYYVEDGLLTLRYRQPPPHEIDVSPLIAMSGGGPDELEARALVNVRSRQVFELLRENIRLRLDAEERRFIGDGPDPGRDERGATLFVSGCAGDAKRYRCDHQAEQLSLAQLNTDTGEYPSSVLANAAGRWNCVVLHRVPFDDVVDGFLQEAHECGTRVLFDADDLVFDPDTTEHVSGLQSMRRYERERMLQSIGLQHETLRRCDAVLTATEPLRETAGKLHPCVFLSPNVVSMAMVAQADAALARRHLARTEGREVTIAYFSGTPTHDVDFLAAADSVLDVLEERANVRLLVVGHLELDRRFRRVEERVERIAFQPWWRLPKILVEVDVNLAPLELGNPFAEAKSCLKYLEAALVGVPTVASPSTDFLRAIEHEQNGLLADTPEEWAHSLHLLVDSPELRRDLGRAAYDDVRMHHTTEARAPALRDLLTRVVPAAEKSRRAVAVDR
jgi:GT2 family glycosyltransferase/glycosyltransferase involved in cell wall biosynthesis